MNRTVLVTGASRGIGRAIASAFAAEGDRLIITCSRSEQELLNFKKELEETFHTEVFASVGDISSFEYVEQLFEQITERFGGVDVLINNAGIGEQKMIDETDDDWMMYVMNTNLGGPMRYIREALRIFLPKNDGVIINVSSVNGTRPFCGATYTSTKGALNTLTKNVAMRLIDTNIRCNAVAPGATVTPAHLANKAGEQPGGAEMLKYSGHFVYFPGPECDPMDQAYACLYLASKMGRHVKGQVLQVCNGAFL